MKQAVILTVFASLAGASSLHAGAVSDWSLVAQNSIVVEGRKFPGEAAVYMGIVHAAIYDAAVAIEGGYRPYRVSPTVPPGASLDAAVATLGNAGKQVEKLTRKGRVSAQCGRQLEDDLEDVRRRAARLGTELGDSPPAR